MRLRIVIEPAASTPCTWKTDFAISIPIVLTSPMDGSPQCGCSNATTLWHLDAEEWAPSTASKGDLTAPKFGFRFTPTNKHRQLGRHVSKVPAAVHRCRQPTLRRPCK